MINCFFRRRPEPLPPGLFAWVLPVLKVSDEEVIKRIGLDSYMFLRFMKMCTILFATFSIIGLPVLLPINSVNQGDGLGLEKFTIGNIRDNKRLWAHVILAWLFSGTFMLVFFRSSQHFLKKLYN
jgi:calcium permeable stress-gated cation channel